MTTKNRFLLPLAALLVAALVAGLTWLVSSRQSSSPHVLRLLGSGAAARDMAAPAAASTSESGTTGSSPYRLTGDLPEGRPADSPVYALAGPYDTSRLAKALTREGLTTEHAAWWWSSSCAEPAMGAPDQPVSSTPDQPAEEGKSVSVCAVSGGGSSGSGGSVSSGSATVAPNEGGKVDPAPPGPQPTSEPGSDGSEPASKPGDERPVMPPMPPSPEPTTPAMTEAQARAAAAPVFEAVDLPIADATVTVTPYGGSVSLDPVVGGLKTVGYTTRVEINRDREVSWASGFLGDVARGDSYPLVTAKEAFDSIATPPVTDMMCRVGPEGKGCEPPPAPEVTGAELGLQLRQTGKGEQVLVPAWLFAVKGWPEPLGQIAISEKFLGEPEPVATDPPMTKDPGQTEPAPPVTPEG